MSYARLLTYDSYDPEAEQLREALCTTGNGYFATRGAAPECSAGDHHYPGTYVAGVYNRLVTEVSGQELENESLVNCPNWLPFTFRVDGGDWFDVDDVDVVGFRQTLELESGILVRSVRFRDPAGRETTLRQRRLAHMARPHVAVLASWMTAENWSGELTIRSWLDGTIVNAGVERYRDLSGDHLEVVSDSTEPFPLVRNRTVQSRIEIVAAARLRLWRGDERLDVPASPVDLGSGRPGVEISATLPRGGTVRAEKVAAIYTSRDRAISEPGVAALETLDRVGDLAELEAEHVTAWRQIWERFAVDPEADDRTRMIVDLHLLHLIQTASANTIDLDVGIPARGLHGEAYRGHIFWDELFVFPLLNTRVPEIARSLLEYRHRRLDAARHAARREGHVGAMFPWQSGSDGREETQVLHLNPRSGRWIPDDTHRQRHIGIAIAANVWNYHRITRDIDFLARYGAEILIEIARFLTGLATYDQGDDRYDIVGVVGPDEFHTADPNWDGSGLRNNAYTNVLTAWVLQKAAAALDPLPTLHRDRLIALLGLERHELEHWDHIGRRLRVPMHDGRIISQFQGYEALEELDWDGYRDRYGDIHRLDRILEAEGDDVNRYKASKQADVLMLFYLMSFEELGALLERLDVPFDEQMLADNVAYYLARTSHGSTLSRVVHSWVLARTDRRRSMELFCEALESDLTDIQGGTTKEGIHLGAMAGTVDLLERGYSGMEMRDGVLRFKPSLPSEISRLRFRIHVRGRWIEVTIVGDSLELTSEPTIEEPLPVQCRGDRRRLGSGETVTFSRAD